MEADDSAINVPAIAAAHVIKRYVAQAPDEISLEVSLSFLTSGDLMTARNFEILIRVQKWPSRPPDANIVKLNFSHLFRSKLPDFSDPLHEYDPLQTYTLYLLLPK